MGKGACEGREREGKAEGQVEASSPRNCRAVKVCRQGY